MEKETYTFKKLSLCRVHKESSCRFHRRVRLRSQRFVYNIPAYTTSHKQIWIVLSQIRNFVLQNNHARHNTHDRGAVSGISLGVVVSFVCLFGSFNSDKNILDFQTIQISHTTNPKTLATLPQTRGYSRPGIYRVQGTTGYRSQWRIPIRHTGT